MTMSPDLSEKVEEVIRLPSELPSGWEKSSLAEVAEIIMGQSPSSEYYNAEGDGLPFFQGKAEFGDLYPEAVKWCSAPGKIAQKDDVLISVRAPVGPTNLAPSECCIGRGLAAIRPRNGIPSKYILHYLRSIESDIDSLGTGTTFKAISGKTLREIPIPIAPPDQQKRIVAEIEKQFSRLDEAIANLKRVKANLKRYKAAVLKAAVEGRLVETEAELARREGRSYETGERLLQRILETRRSQWKGKGRYKEPAAPDTTDLPELPEGWVWASAVQACDPVVDCHNKTAPYTDSGIPLVRTTNIRDGRLLLEEVRYVDQPTYDFWSKRCPPEPGDVLFTREAPMGEAAIIPPGFKLCMGQRMMLMRPSSAIATAFLLYALMSPVIKRLIERTAVGTGVKHLRVGDVELLPIPIPPSPEQDRIVTEVDRRFSLVREVEAQVDANLKRTERLRHAVLCRAFSGGMCHGNALALDTECNVVASSA
jgi:type I restriction enzyme S subunit